MRHTKRRSTTMRQQCATCESRRDSEVQKHMKVGDINANAIRRLYATTLRKDAIR